MADQAQKLREFVKRSHSHARVLAVTSGKGGVGKTNMSVNLSIALTARGKRVVLLDADLGLANVEVILGINSLYNLQHVVDGEMSIMQVLVQGPGGIHVIPGSSGIAKLADLGPAARQNVMKGLEEIQGQFDYIVIDTMAGIGQNAVSFCVAADEVLLVTTPEPHAIVDAYAMLKAIYANRDDAVIRLIVNMASNEKQALAVSKKLTGVTKDYLGRNLSTLGYIPRDPHVSQGVMQSFPFTIRYPHAPATRSIHALADRLVRQNKKTAHEGQTFFKRLAQTLGIASNA